MIISLEHNAVIIPDGLVEYLKSITVRPYRPLKADYTESYDIKRLSGLRLCRALRFHGIVTVSQHIDP